MNKPYGKPIGLINLENKIKAKNIAKDIGSDKSDDFNFANTLSIIREFTGTFRMQTENEFLLKIENLFFQNLILNGAIFITKQNKESDKYEIYYASSIKTNIYNEVIEVNCQVLRYYFSSVSNDNTGQIFTFVAKGEGLFNFKNKKRGEDFPGCYIMYNDNTINFWITTYPFIEKMNRTHQQLDASISVKNKKFIYNQLNNDDNVANLFESSIKDPTSLFITLADPKIFNSKLGNLSLNHLEPVETGKVAGLEVREAVEYIEYLRDKIGLSGSANPVKKERNITAEFDAAETNTSAMEETIMRNLNILSKWFLEQGDEVKFGKTKELLEEGEENEQDIQPNIPNISNMGK